jgi:hypothetical protein
VCGELDRPAGVVFHFVFAAGAQEAAAAKLLSKDEGRIAVYNYQIAGQRRAVRFFIAVAGVPVIGLRYSALGETRSVKERSRTGPSRLRAFGSATAALWNDRPTAI